MKTVEEIADKHLSEAMKGSMGSPMNSFYNGFLEGYNEAMRWRDVNKELPENDNLVQVKYISIFSTDYTEYGYDSYTYEHNMWNICQDVCIKVTHWRPIE